jgi:5-methylcytosine-specific restriction endonuclease McrBC GTP-binding regulatory subunit McrB
MEYWKLGCRWGKKSEGFPLFNDLLVENKIVISWIDRDFGNGNFVLLTDGFKPLAIARTLSERKPINELLHLEAEFNEREIYYDDRLFYYKAEIFEVNEPNFSYDFQKGIAQIHSAEVIQNIDRIYSHFKSEIIMQQNIKLLKFKKQIILQGPPGTGKTRMAKELARLIVKEDISETEVDLDQIQIVQFHPSYSYEDFVRGIVIQPSATGEGLIYEPENKIFGNIIELAKQNKIESQKDEQTISKENWLYKQLEKYVFEIKKAIETSIRKSITEKVDIVGLDENAFRYKGKKGWSKLGNRMLFEDLVQAYLDQNTTRQDVKLNTNLSGLANWHATYYIKVLDDFRKYLDNNKLKYENALSVESFEKVNPKKYVLIIDEMNRANLSSVLGELIYALEYRGEKVSSMYALDGNYELQIPDNLYIIGTMNTADRSVSEIDYAIRRRFAFVDVLPNDLSSELGEDFDSLLFQRVQRLFKSPDNKKSEYLTGEFESEQVQLGHSYFIKKDKEGGSMEIRWKYEIKPILREYVKDGILKVAALEEIDKIEKEGNY